MNSPTPKRRYRKPPILEAICEIHFAGVDLSVERMKAAQDLWKGLYPHQQLVREKNVEFKLGMAGEATMEDSFVGHRVICRSEDKLNLAQLSNKFLAVNQIRPYVGWEEGFRDTILARWKELEGLYNIEATARIGLRYINRIEIPEQPFHWEDWFNYSLPLPPEFRQGTSHFHLSFQQPIERNMRSAINIARAEGAPDGYTWVILDIDIALEGHSAAERVPALLEEVHGPHSLAFEGYLADKLRERFAPI